MTPIAFVHRLFVDASRVDRTSIEPLYALRSIVGVALPLGLALMVGHPLSGVSAALGAMCVGFASRQGVYRTRAAVMLATSAATALGALVGSLTGGIAPLNIGVTALWGTAFGIIAALGDAANAVGLNSLVALIVFSQFGFTSEQAAQQALLVFAGGALQTVLLVIVWPLQRFTAERRVLERAYRALGEAAVHPPPSYKMQAPDSRTLRAVSETLADPQPFAKRGETAVFEALLAEAERIRGSLTALITDHYALDGRELPRASAAFEALRTAAHDVLVEIADALHEARAPRDLAPTWTLLDGSIDELQRELRAMPAAAYEYAGILRRSVGDGRGLSGQLRAAWRASKAPEEPNPGPPSESPSARLFRPGVFADALATVRANVSLRSPFGRHALRVGGTLALACIAEHVLPLHHAYWIPLTAAIVLRPDFGATFTRGTARVGGTLLGVLAASLIAVLLRPGTDLDLVLALLAAAAAYLTVGASFALFTLFITAYVVFLLAFGGLSAHAAVVERLAATLLGGLVALAAYAAWPAWERERVSDRLAELLEKDRLYGMLVLRAYADPAARDDTAIQAAQLAVRLARSTAETSVDRMLAEPVHTRAVSVRAALGILAATRRFGLATLTLQARLPRAQPVAEPKLALLRDALDTSLLVLASALRQRTDGGPLPPLRDLQIVLRDSFPGPAAAEAAGLVSETDLMVDSVKMIADLIHRAHAQSEVENQAQPQRLTATRRHAGFS